MSVVRETHIFYTVQPGDTLFSIAQRYGSTVEQIERANILFPPFTDPGLIFPGWSLLIPVPAEQPYRTIYIVASGDTVFRIAQRFNTVVDLIAGINRLPDPNLIGVGQPLWTPGFVYEIQEGDTLTSISRRFQTPISAIIAANDGRPGFSLDLILPGFRLQMPLPSSRDIVVIRPLPGDTVGSGVRVEGFARTFEANVLFQIRDDNNVIVSAERFTTALEGAPAYGYFSTTLPFDQEPTSPSGEIWVYARSPKDGRIIQLVQVRVDFS